MADIKEIEDRLQRLEARTKTNFFEVEKKLTQLESPDQTKQFNVDERIQELEDLILLLQLENTKIKERVDTEDFITPSTEKLLPEGIVERLSSLEEELDLLKPKEGQPAEQVQEKASTPAQIPVQVSAPTQTLLQEKIIEKVDEETKNKVQELENSIKNLEASVQARLSQVSEKPSPKIDQTYFHQFKHQIDEETARLEEMRRTITSIFQGKNDLVRRLEKSEIDSSKIDSFFNKINTYDEKIGADIERIDTLKENFETKIDVIENKIRKIELLDSRISEKIQEYMKNYAEEFKRKDVVEMKPQYVPVGEDDIRNATYTKKNQDINNKIFMLEKEISKISALEKHIEEESVLRASIDRKIGSMTELERQLREMKGHGKEDIASKMREVERKIMELSQSKEKNIDMSPKMREIERKIMELSQTKERSKENKMESGTDNRFKEYHEKLSEIERRIGSLTELERHLREMKTEKGKENKAESEMASRFKEYQAKLSEMRAGIEKVLEDADVRGVKSELASMRRSLVDIEKNYEIKANKFLIEHLEKFAKIIDKKLPTVATKSDYERLLTAYNRLSESMEKKGKTVLVDKVVQSKSLEQRIASLEVKISELAGMMRNVSGRVPIVVE